MKKSVITDLKRARTLIRSAQRIVLATHENPDGDGIGSMLAIAHYCSSLKKKHALFVRGMIPAHFSFLPRYTSLAAAISFHAADLVIGFDYGNYHRLALPFPISGTTALITFDHHPKADQRGNVIITEPSCSSTAELVYRFFSVNHIPITRQIATCIYAGIVADTGGFVHRNTTADTFAAASRLLACAPINAEWIAKKILGFPSSGAARIVGIVLSRIAVDERTKMAYSHVSWRDLQKYGVAWEEVDVIVNLMNYINNDAVKYVALFKEKNDGMIAISFRSDAEKAYNVKWLAQALGGGGHRFASATRMKGSLKAVMEKTFACAAARR